MKAQPRDPMSNGLWRDYFADLAKWSLLYAPGVTFVVTLLFESFDSLAIFLDSFLKSIFIGEVVVVFSVTMSYLLAACEEFLFKWRGKPSPVHTDLFHTIRSASFLLPGLFLGFKALEIFAPWFGSSFSPPSFGQYRYGIIIGSGSIGFWLILSLFANKRASDSRIQELEKEHLNAKVAALSAQMNPL